MLQFMLTYLGGDKPATPEEGQAHMAEYQAWISALGDAAVSPMNPFKDSRTLKPDGTVNPGSSIGMSGYTILQADSMEEALSMAKDCPFLGIGGTLEVSELMKMPG